MLFRSCLKNNDKITSLQDKSRVIDVIQMLPGNTASIKSLFKKSNPPKARIPGIVDILKKSIFATN